ncbi:MAG: hypothetical protein ACR2PY_05820 [Salinispira sp.]
MGKLCNKDHSNIAHILEDIKQDQGGNTRHQCAGCAYEMGFEHGQKNMLSDEYQLPKSQRGIQRHKSPVDAFARGIQDGRDSK